MKKNFFTFFIFIFLEVIIYTSLIYNENLHINKVLDNNLHNSHGELKVLREYFFEESDEKIYSKFSHIVLLKSTLDIKTYQDYEKKIEKLSTLFTDVRELNYLKNKKVFEVIKNKEEKVLLFEKGKTSICISFIPYYFDSKNVLNYFIRFNNQSQIYDMKFRTNILFLVFSILIAILVGYTYFIYNIKTKLSIKNEENEELLNVIDKYILMTETDKEGFITKVSTAFCEVTGFSKRELIGRPHNIIRHPDVKRDVFKQMWDEIKSGKIWKGEIKNIDKNGNIYWVEGTIVPKYDKDKNIIGYLSLRKDITDKKRLDELNGNLKYQIEEKINEMEILDSNLIQQSKKALVGDLLDIIAHQWKQPLSIMSLYAIDLSESVKYGEMNQEYANELSEKFQRQIAHLSSTLTSFRTFFSPSDIYDKFTLYENVENVLLLLEDELKINKIDIKIEGDKNIKIYGISNEFQHIFLNFISNSRDAFIEKGIKNRQIIISFFEKNGQVQIDYIDNAGGIKENILHKIFDLNFTTKPIGLGTGVGMYATKLIIDKLSGKISVNNYKDGVNFRILLPNKDRKEND